jgi:hypothetical protein
MHGRRSWRAALLCLGLLAVAGGFESASEPAGRAQGYLVSGAGAGRGAALAQAAGEFRIVAANLLWSKVVDHYHHQYMAEGGDWSKNESLLPLLQTIITLDPHFVQAYEIMGGAILPRTGRARRGAQVLDAGIARNRGEAGEWELCREAALLADREEHDPVKALGYARLGLEQTRYARDEATGGPDEFAIRLMTKLCHTLGDQAAAGHGAAAGSES